MPSPFPGMDPYVEVSRRWPSFHASYIARSADFLNERLPPNYVATIDERVQLEPDEDGDAASSGQPAKRLGPDVAVVRRGPDAGGGKPGGAAAGSVATLEPHTLPQRIEWLDEPTQKYIEILALPDQRVVTTIELLSPSNKKPGKDRTAYLAKRQDLLHRSVSLVEVDLLLRGDRLPLLEPLPAADYFTFVTRGEHPDRCEVYAWGVREVLPTIPVPLKPEHGDVPLDLASVFAQTYERGRFHMLLRYDTPPRVSLQAKDVQWAAEAAASAR